ncbi:unnamed protein product [Adineta steineri]|uniref:TIR domain-containing protein n=1 Tax=Adineta steineri TaxID=433720 RepID=A0A815RUA8_9BILA|nr:unnamed protein product [Adineta steineri]
MEDHDLTRYEITKPTYLSLLQEIDKLLNLSSNLNKSDLSEIETIFNNVTENIDRLTNQMDFQKSTMFFITILNTIVRMSAISGSDILISRQAFQSMYEKLNYFIMYILNEKDCSPMFANDILDSIFLNLVIDDFVEICFKRLLSNETILTIGFVTTNEEFSQYDRIDFPKIIEQYIGHANTCVSIAVIRSKYEFSNRYSSLMIYLQEFINNYLTTANHHHIRTRLLYVIASILTLIWNLTDKIALIPIFIDTGYIQKSIEWICTDIFASHINILGNPIISIIHNLSRDKIGLKQLRTKKTFDILMERKQLINDENNEDLTKVFGRAVIALAVNDEQSENNKKFILDTSEILYQSSKDANQDVELKSDGYHLSELLELLHRAFTNTYVIKHILEDMDNEKSAVIQYFAELFLSFYGVLLDPEPDELEKRAVKYLVKILLQISSYPEYLKELIENNQFYIIIQSLANRSQRDDVKRIWCNIQQIMIPNVPKKEMSPMIYISYDYTDEEFCREFVKELRKKSTIPIWIDYENVELCDGMWEYVSSTILSATVVIILVSTAYVESTDKFQELSYIISTNKSRDENKGLIIVTMEPNFNFKRSWMKDLLHDKIMIPYDNNIGYMASNVCEQMGVSKKSLVKSLRCQVRNVQRKTVQSDGFTENFESSPTPTKAYVQKESPNKTNDTNILSTSKKESKNCIAAGLMTQTGSAGDLTWM